MNETLLAHDHAALDTTMAELIEALNKGDSARSLDRLDFFWGHLAVHIRAENIHLFPALLAAAKANSGSDQAADAPNLEEAQVIVDQLRHDHDVFMKELTSAMKQLRAICRNAESGNLADVRPLIDAVNQRLETHNELEESRVYHWAALMLDEAAQKALHKKIQAELENLPPRFRKPGA